MILAIRTFRLRPGTREEFLRLTRDMSLPMLEEHGIRVVDWGPSLIDQDAAEEAYVMRAFPSLEAHRQQDEAFYGSAEWRNGPREEILSLVESYHTIVIEATAEAVDALQR